MRRSPVRVSFERLQQNAISLDRATHICAPQLCPQPSAPIASIGAVLFVDLSPAHGSLHRARTRSNWLRCPGRIHTVDTPFRPHQGGGWLQGCSARADGRHGVGVVRPERNGFPTSWLRAHLTGRCCCQPQIIKEVARALRALPTSYLSGCSRTPIRYAARQHQLGLRSAATQTRSYARVL